MKTKKELIDTCRKICMTYKRRTLPNYEKEWLIKNILCHRKDWDWWKSRGVKDIKSWNNYTEGKYMSHCFFVVFEDGTEADISYHKAVGDMTKEQVKMVPPYERTVDIMLDEIMGGMV